MDQTQPDVLPETPAVTAITPSTGAVKILSPRIARAILKTSDEIGMLAKDRKNVFANYDYASIDLYYETVAAIARQNGITWMPKEVSAQIIDKSVKYEYSFTLMFRDGTGYPDYFFISIVHPIQGPQTTSSAMSYAEKGFMRVLFKVPTGEPDADEVDNSNGRRRPMHPARREALQNFTYPVREAAPKASREADPAPAPRTEQQSDRVNSDMAPQMIEDVMTSFAQGCRSFEALTTYWKEHQDIMRMFEERYPDRLDRIKRAFTARKAVLAPPSSRVGVPTAPIRGETVIRGLPAGKTAPVPSQAAPSSNQPASGKRAFSKVNIPYGNQ